MEIKPAEHDRCVKALGNVMPFADRDPAASSESRPSYGSSPAMCPFPYHASTERP